ncbi:MAG: hypothetical protein R2744_13790 [Bacteroidales bacterium]
MPEDDESDRNSKGSHGRIIQNGRGLPYGQGNFVMDVILPDEGITPRELMESFDGNSLSLALASMTEVETELYTQV